MFVGKVSLEPLGEIDVKAHIELIKKSTLNLVSSEKTLIFSNIAAGSHYYGEPKSCLEHRSTV